MPTIAMVTAIRTALTERFIEVSSMSGDRLRSYASIQLRPALFHELCAFGEVGETELTELLGRAADRLRAVGDDALAHVGPLEDFDELVVKPRDDGRGQARGPDHAVPADEFESGQLFRYCGQVGQGREALGRGDREPAQLARAHLDLRRLDAREIEVVLPGDQIHQRRPCALVRDM